MASILAKNGLRLLASNSAKWHPAVVQLKWGAFIWANSQLSQLNYALFCFSGLHGSAPAKGGHHWMPDLEYAKSLGHKQDMYVDKEVWESFVEKVDVGEERKKSYEMLQPEPEFFKEKTLRNMQLNFGPAHPAAHGVLRLILQLDGEVCEESHSSWTLG